MQLADVNILISAHRPESERHEELRRWLLALINGDAAYGMSELVLGAFVRIVTNRRVYRDPTTLEVALAFTEQLRSQPHCAVIAPGPRHWEIFTHLCRRANARGNLISDAYFAALAIESGSEWITMDRGFSRFPGLRWRHPLD